MRAKRCYVVLDTESSVCQKTFRRVLVSIAYEVVYVDVAHHYQEVRRAYYDVVKQPTSIGLDNASEKVHGISVSMSQLYGKHLYKVLQRLFAVLKDVQPDAIVGHDIVMDVRLLINEALRVGIDVRTLNLFGRLLCTRELTTAHCRLPLPNHLRYEYPCDKILETWQTDPPCHSMPLYKWPTLNECYGLLVSPDASTLHHIHDARCDVQTNPSSGDERLFERCRAVFMKLLMHRTKKQLPVAA